MLDTDRKEPIMQPLLPSDIQDLRAELDENIDACEVYRSSWLRAERELEIARDEIRRLKRITGRGNVATVSDIAKYAEVSRHTVLTWIERYPEFPKPLEGSSPREYAKDRVKKWCLDTGRKWKE